MIRSPRRRSAPTVRSSDAASPSEGSVDWAAAGAETTPSDTGATVSQHASADASADSRRGATKERNAREAVMSRARRDERQDSNGAAYDARTVLPPCKSLLTCAEPTGSDR